MDSGATPLRKLPIRTKSKAQKRKAADDASSASALGQVPTTRPDIGFKFRHKSAKKIFLERFHDRTIIAERLVNLSDLQESQFQIISRIFTQRRWEYFISPPARPFINLVRKFYANMEIQQVSDEHVDAPLQIISFIRGMQIVVTREVIAEVTGIPLIEEPGYPYPTEDFPSKTDMTKLFIPLDSYNIWQDYMKFIYALFTDVHIDFASIAIRLMKAIFSETSISLPYGSLISRIIAKFVQIPDSEPTTKHFGPFYTTEPIPSGGVSTSALVSLEDVMATQTTTFSSILTSLQKDVKELKTKVVGSSGVDEENDKEQSMRD
ncbi:hypothetical protein FH972_005826 [Carpinus fangiana]|uniref:Uncharacterized protein n=1 Tax=Carpinus fangiana TaxID=176857 RepID=A0A5N6QSC6_9ROSI|nr:hypothetical protein FH972_005826 [Carpinus fangiana]